MRHVFARRWGTESSSAYFDMHAVDMSSVGEASRRDLWFRLIRDGTSNEADLYATKTYAQAIAITAQLADTAAARQAAYVVAYSLALTMDATRRTITLTNQTGMQPNMLNLAVTYTGGIQSGTWHVTHGYQSSPARVVTEEIDNILEEYMGPGEALEDFTAARVIRGPEELQVLSIAPNIVASIAEEEDGEAAAGEHAVNVRGTVIVACRNLTSKGETAYDNALKYAGAVRSIIGDERRTLNDICLKTTVGSVEGPELMAGPDEPGYMGARVTYLARFPSMTPDR